MKIRLHEPTFGEEEIQAVVDVLRSGNVTSGNRVRELESHFGKHAVMVNSGSSANLLAVAMLCNPAYPNHLKPGDEVIVSALSWSTTVWPWVQYGIVPVIVDIDPDTLNIDVMAVAKAITGKTRAIMPVHVYGNPCDTVSLKVLSQDHDLFLVEDCCESLGMNSVQRGVLATYSFYFSHHITTLEGGMVVASNEEQEDLLKVLRAHGWTREMKNPPKYEGIDPRFLFINAGYNLRASEVNAAMGLVQIKKLADFVSNRRKTAGQLKEIFKPYPVRTQEDCGSSWFGFPLVAKDGLRQHFEECGIETRPVICGNIARQPGMKLWEHRVSGELKHADEVMQHGFAIPCHQGMTDDDCEHIKNSLGSYYD